ncbi:MAG: ribosomal protein S18-alanine N-acetyltransferase, partial [Candidatus Saganbacteria bacterium]|nr:ribosomal protein S18-alanine N-acetyltransferase [Candidatus Saganbacteria bacterium]
ISKIRSNGIYLAAVKEDRVLGFIGCDVVLDEGHIARLAVDTDFRGKGIGRKLVGALIDLAKGESIKDLLLEVRASNIISKRLYESFGFKIVRTRKEYYSGPTEDALVMEKKIETD